MLQRVVLRLPLLALALLLPVAGCDCGGGTNPPGTCTSLSDCDGGLCIDGMCHAPSDGGGLDGATRDGGFDAGDGGDCTSPCGSACCVDPEVCVSDGVCATAGPACTTGDDCADDSYCDATLGVCLPYDVPTGHDRDPSCSRVIVAGTFSPTVQCEFSVAPAGDAFPANLHVLGTPMVADLRAGAAPSAPSHPSIVAVFDDGADGSSEQPTGVIRILDGASCEQQAELGSLQMVCHDCPPAIGDLDGDGKPEIVAFKAGGGMVAFHYDDATSAWAVLWTTTAADGTTPFNPTGGGWAGPSLVDLDDDGVPEVLRFGMVFDNAGHLIDQSLGATFGYGQGTFSVVADVDGDGIVELVQGHGVWQWDNAARAWAPETWSPGGSAAGHVAIADFGDFPGGVAWPSDAPEVAVVSRGQVRLQTLDGMTVFGPIALPGGGTGGPPTIGDFDGDGRPEFASAGATDYTVFDLDCTATPVGECAPGRTDGVLWAQPSQDASSNVTGSSIFDFEGDGPAEAVYGDECFLRVYSGATGDVVFSQYRSSCTWYENPVIADVDGDFNAEIVIGNNYNCGSASSGVACGGLDPGGLDPLFAGLHCSENSDCLSGSCDSGLCRCTSDADCCTDCDRDGFACAAPPAATPGAGNTCRASHPHGALGIRVYRDSADRWVRSRMIWNQHAYFVTNVNDDGTIPRTSAAGINWTTPGLNNFRQNVQGSAIPDAAPDLTSRSTPVACAERGIATLTANVCNRGTEPVGAGLLVGFYDGDPALGVRICQVPTTGVLGPGACEPVSCTWSTAPDAMPGRDVVIVADDASSEGECHEGNNRTTLPGVFCQGLE